MLPVVHKAAAEEKDIAAKNLWRSAQHFENVMYHVHDVVGGLSLPLDH